MDEKGNYYYKWKVPTEGVQTSTKILKMTQNASKHLAKFQKQMGQKYMMAQF
jgi:hypothetical protein